MFRNIKIKSAFTLAEALVVLGVISLIAALTIPSLIQNSQNAALAVKAKKAYLEFNKVLDQLTTDYDCLGNLRCTGVFASGVATAITGDALVGYFDVAQNCGILGTAASPLCFANPQNQGKDGDGTSGNWNSTSYYNFITTDGVTYSIQNMGCTAVTNALANMKEYCGYLRVDVNGPSGPNRLGRDCFVFYITNGKGAVLYPVGGVDDYLNLGMGTNSWWRDPSTKAPRYCIPGVQENNSNKCTGRLVEEGWKMNY